MQLIPYLYFRGNCEEALNFYAAAGLGVIGDIARYRDGPPGGPQADPNWVMNASLTGDGFEMMASDGAEAMPMKGIALTLALYDLPRAKALFASLSEGGNVTMPMARMFWGADFGAFTDRFGVQWQINCTSA